MGIFDQQTEPSVDVPTPAQGNGSADNHVVRNAHAASLELWRTGKILEERWLQLFIGVLAGAKTPDDVTTAAQLADLAYFAMLQRQRLLEGR